MWLSSGGRRQGTARTARWFARAARAGVVVPWKNGHWMDKRDGVVREDPAEMDGGDQAIAPNQTMKCSAPGPRRRADASSPWERSVPAARVLPSIPRE